MLPFIALQPDEGETSRHRNHQKFRKMLPVFLTQIPCTQEHSHTAAGQQQGHTESNRPAKRRCCIRTVRQCRSKKSVPCEQHEKHHHIARKKHPHAEPTSVVRYQSRFPIYVKIGGVIQMPPPLFAHLPTCYFTRSHTFWPRNLSTSPRLFP